MNEPEAIWSFIASHLAEERAVVLMIVVRSEGSAPGRPGFKMAVAGDRAVGTIGGGIMEYRLVEHARTLIAAGQPVNELLQRIHHKKAPVCTTVRHDLCRSSDHCPPCPSAS